MNNFKYVMDVMGVIEKEFNEIMLINLSTYKFIDLKSNIRKEYDDIHRWVSEYINTNIIYTLDIDNQISIDDLDSIKKHFKKSNKKISIKCKMNPNDKWVDITIYKSSDYTESNQIVILFVKDIDNEFNRILDKQKELEEISYIDKLTSIGNRRALDKFSESSKNNIGVLYLDLNGLKEVNDTLGHEFGDHFLKSCANLLTSHFRKSECYRIGGDEFVATIENIKYDIFMNKINFLTEDAKLHNINISIGYEWSNNGNITDIINKAEKKMRQSKNKYYETHKRYR